MEFNRNNLDKASSPYLQQHKDNPIWWQEWSKEVHEYARKQNKPLFFSIGYATCHWCHVMARQAFEDQDIAHFLNEHFISVKIDREQRPDIDQYLMAYIYQTRGSGGWPLNVFLTPDLKPFFAVTYVGVKPEHGIPAFLDLLQKIKTFYDENKDTITDYTQPHPEARVVRHVDLISQLVSVYDPVYGGFGTDQKFPPYTTLIFLMHYFDYTHDKGAKTIIEKTLDMMAMRGLHDHLHGGFYRYCVDRAWTIPHFEKLLYDQALMLWVYSVGYKLLKKDAYKIVAEKILTCLDDSFAQDGLYITGYSAEVEGQEGKTYVWEFDELQKILSDPQLEEFKKVYEISEQGNFEGKNHLLKQSLTFLPEIEKKLLDVRLKRTQPFADKKIVTSWNALLGVAYVIAYRCFGNVSVLQKAQKLFKDLNEKHLINNVLYHSSINNTLQKQSFLQDYATMLVFATYLNEESGEYNEHVKKLYNKTKTFYEHGLWYETRDGDFKSLPAQLFDHPTPSSISMAEYGILRADILAGNVFMPGHYKTPLSYDFYNLITLIKSGCMHIIDVPEKVNWEKLPLNVIQRIKQEKIKDCFNGECKEFDSVETLVEVLKKTK